MPTIYPNLVPSIEPGNLFSKLVDDNSLSIRWITKQDPVMFEVGNRPIADVAVRQLIIAKAVDQINLRLGHQAYFPFISQPQIISGAAAVNIPLSWIWDMNVTLPEKWTDLRLAKIKRISGTNTTGTGGEYDGMLRLFFSASVDNGVTEYYIFYADYDIASVLTYQTTEIVVVTDEESPAISPAELNTVAGQVAFRTLDVDDADVRSFLDSVPPPADTTDSNSNGFYDNPSSYNVTDDVPGVVNSSPVSHGSGLLTDSAYNRLPDLGASVDSWVEAFNYPFRVNADRQSFTIVGGEAVTIPSGMFVEFNMTAPAGDNESVDYNSSPVWITRIKLGQIGNVDPNYITCYFATYNILDDNTSVAPIEFGVLTLPANGNPGDILPINPINNLFGQTSITDLFNQQFGRGHVVLSSKWGGIEISDFFDQFPLIVGSDQIEFTQTSSVLSSFSLSRNPKYSPTKGQNQAFAGSSARLDNPIHPSDDNRYVTEADQGRGDRVDLNAKTNPITSAPIEPNPDIEQYGYEGSLITKEVSLIVNASGTEHTYETDILPRLRCLFNREFVHGDGWFDGTRWKKWDSFSDSWVG